MYYISLVLMLLLSGASLIYLAWVRKKAIERTLGVGYKYVPMEVLEVNIMPNYLYGEAVLGPLDERTSIIFTRYRYIWNGKIYESQRVFPLDVEWIKPRISLFSLFEDLKAKRLTHCFVDTSMPSQAVLFRGWSPYLKQHVVGVFASGFLVFFLGIFSARFFYGMINY